MYLFLKLSTIKIFTKVVIQIKNAILEWTLFLHMHFQGKEEPAQRMHF